MTAALSVVPDDASVTLPQHVIDKEHKIAADLGELRWHWTANEDNPARVSYSEYARQTGANRSHVHRSVQRFVAQGDKTIAEPVDNRGGARDADPDDDDPDDEPVNARHPITLLVLECMRIAGSIETLTPAVFDEPGGDKTLWLAELGRLSRAIKQLRSDIGQSNNGRNQ